MKRICTAVLVAGSMVALPSVAEYSAMEAAADTGFYVGASAGIGKAFTSVSDLTGTAEVDEDDVGYKATVGYRFHRHLSLEFIAADFGETEISGNAGDTFRTDDVIWTIGADDLDVKVGARSYALAGVISLPLSDTVRPYGKLGVHFWELDTTPSINLDGRDGTDAMFGLGVEIDLTEHLFMRAEYESYDFNGNDAELGTLGLFLKF